MAALAGLQGDAGGAGLEGTDAGAGADGECAIGGDGGIDRAREGADRPVTSNMGSDTTSDTGTDMGARGPGAPAFPGPMPGSGIVHLEGFQAVQVGLAMLARFRAAQTGGRGKLPQHRRATVAETNASIAKKLDSLAQRLRASSVEGGV